MRIFLIGFMGSGKSHWGKRWAETNRMEFHDLDAMIEAAEKSPVVDIFEKAGEDYFRVRESSMLRDMNKFENSIIACGGGAPCFYENMQWMNEHGITVYLSASPNFILEKVKEEKDKRPLIKNVNEAELLFFIEQKLKERLSFYTQAKYTLDAENLDSESLSPIIFK